MSKKIHDTSLSHNKPHELVLEVIMWKLEQDISGNQFRFSTGLGTREALFTFNIMPQRCQDLNKEMYARFMEITTKF